MSGNIFDSVLEAGVEVISVASRKRLSSTRIILAHIDDLEYMVLSPNGDIEVEHFDPSGARYAIRDDINRDIPTGFGRLSEDFDPVPNPEDLDALIERAESDARDLLETRGVRQADDLAARKQTLTFGRPSTADREQRSRPSQSPGARPGGLPLLGSQSALTPAQRSSNVGAPNRPDGPRNISGGLGALSAAISLGAGPGNTPRGPVEVHDEPPADLRVLPVKYDRTDQRFRDFRDGVCLLESHSFTDWPVLGPRTVVWVCQFMLHRSNTPLGWHQEWKNLGRLSDDEGLVHEHETICRLLETAVCYDQLQVGALASFEVLARELQITEDKMSHRFSSQSNETMHDYHIMSGFKNRSALCICPELRSYMSLETAKESAILKERRKAREERTLAHPKGKAKAKAGPGGGGDG